MAAAQGTTCDLSILVVYFSFDKVPFRKICISPIMNSAKFPSFIEFITSVFWFFLNEREVISSALIPPPYQNTSGVTLQTELGLIEELLTPTTLSPISLVNSPPPSNRKVPWCLINTYHWATCMDVILMKFTFNLFGLTLFVLMPKETVLAAD